MCVQRFDDSQCSAIHITFRASLRSSSMREPRDPLLKVLNSHGFKIRQDDIYLHEGGAPQAEPRGRRSTLSLRGPQV
jgi:virulence-associated protein VapD